MAARNPSTPPSTANRMTQARLPTRAMSRIMMSAPGRRCFTLAMALHLLQGLLGPVHPGVHPARAQKLLVAA